MIYPNPYGTSDFGLETISPENLQVASAIVPDLIKLRKEAFLAGFSLKIESAYRSFDRQLSIWNRKAMGKLPLLDAFGNPLKKQIDDEETLMRTILLWSALPGASRHHFGTDIDVSDALHTPKDYVVELTPAECNGMFCAFHDWITEESSVNKLFGFQRVFVPLRGKVQPEKWHISHIPSARKVQEFFSAKKLREIYENKDIACKSAILDNLQNLLDDYVYPYFI